MDWKETSDYVFAVLYNRVFGSNFKKMNATTRAQIYKSLEKAKAMGIDTYKVIVCAKNCTDLSDFYKALTILEKDWEEENNA